MSRVREVLFGGNPYEGFVPEDHEPDLQGWGSNHPVFREVISALRPELIIEAGSWKGASAITMANACQALGLESEILCIDTWLGAAEMWDREGQPDLFASLKLNGGFPSLYYTFARNIHDAGVAHVVTPLPLPMNVAAQVLSRRAISAPMIFIDGSHDYESVRSDIASFAPLLRPEGAMIFDDYMADMWKGVTRAVDEFAAETDRHVYGVKGKAVVSAMEISVSLPKIR